MTLNELKAAVRNLSDDDLKAFARWFAEFKAKNPDRFPQPREGWAEAFQAAGPRDDDDELEWE